MSLSVIVIGCWKFIKNIIDQLHQSLSLIKSLIFSGDMQQNKEDFLHSVYNLITVTAVISSVPLITVFNLSSKLHLPS